MGVLTGYKIYLRDAGVYLADFIKIAAELHGISH